MLRVLPQKFLKLRQLKSLICKPLTFLALLRTSVLTALLKRRKQAVNQLAITLLQLNLTGYRGCATTLSLGGYASFSRLFYYLQILGKRFTPNAIINDIVFLNLIHKIYLYNNRCCHIFMTKLSFKFCQLARQYLKIS